MEVVVAHLNVGQPADVESPCSQRVARGLLQQQAAVDLLRKYQAALGLLTVLRGDKRAIFQAATAAQAASDFILGAAVIVPAQGAA